MPPLISQMLPGLPRRLRLARRGPSRCRAPFFLPVYSNRDQNKCPQHIKANETAVVESSRIETTMDEEEGHGAVCGVQKVSLTFSASHEAARRRRPSKSIISHTFMPSRCSKVDQIAIPYARTQQDYCHCVEKCLHTGLLHILLVSLALL